MKAVRAAAALAGVLLATELLFWAAGHARGPVVFDVGPSTGAYHQGFSESEERPPTTFRWTGGHASLSLPLAVEAGEGVLTIRHQGHFRDVTAHVWLGGQPAGSFPAPPGPFQVTRLPVAAPAGLVRIDILPEGPPDPGIAVDWIRLEGLRVRLPLSVWGPRVLVAGLFVLSLLAGFSLAGAATAAGTLALALAAWAARDPFACAHATARLAVPGLALAALAVVFFRKRPAGRYVVLLVLGSHLLKGSALFDPAYFYNDVRNNRRFVQALGGSEGTLLERGHRAQVQFGVAYPRIVAGKKYAFPYSPVFFLPFTLAGPTSLAVDEAMKQAVLAIAAAEVLLVYWIAGLALGAASGGWAALFAAVLPVLSSRLMLALWATLGGHFLDTLLLGAALAMAARPASRAAVAGFASALSASLLTYVASLFNVTLFAGCLGLLERAWRRRIALAWAAGVALTLGLLYRDFVVTFALEILPAALRGGSDAAKSGGGGLLATLDRIRIFYGYGFPALAGAGFLLLQRRLSPEARHVVSAWALAFCGLVLLRSLPGGLLKDLKEMEFVAPLVALSAGFALEELASRGRSGRAAAALIALGLLAFGLSRHFAYAATWTALAGL